MRRLTDRLTEPMFSTGPEKRAPNDVLASDTEAVPGLRTEPVEPPPAERTAGGSSWGTPIPFDSHEGLPAFPLEALPSWLTSYVQALSISTQTPADLPAMLTLAALAAVTAKTARVLLRGDYSEPLNVFVAIALPPASRKSAVFKNVSAPLSDYERAEIGRLAPIRETAILSRKLAEKKLERAVGAEETKDAEIERLTQEKNAINVPSEPRLIAEDCTPEKLASLLAEHGGRIAVLSAEGGGVFDGMAGRYERAPNLDVFLKGHAGDDLRVDRVGRAAEFVRSPALTLGLMIQPSVLRAACAVPGFRGRGLLARFLYAIPPNTIGSRKADPPSMPSHTRETYERNIRALLARRGDDHRKSAEQSIRLSPAAKAAWIRFSEELEPRLGPGGDLEHVGDWAGKLAGAVGRIAGLLHMANRADSRESAAMEEITAETMDNAIRIGRYLTAHALAAFDLMGADPVIENSRTVLAWILRARRDSFTVRDVHQALKSRFPRVGEFAEPLRVLAERGYVRDVEAPPRGGAGRPPSPSFEVNPCLSKSSQSSERVGRAGSEDSEISERGGA